MQQGFPFISVIAVIFLSFTTVFKILEVFAVISSEKGKKDAVMQKITIISRVLPWNVFLQKIQQDDSGPHIVTVLTNRVYRLEPADVFAWLSEGVSSLTVCPIIKITDFSAGLSIQTQSTHFLQL